MSRDEIADPLLETTSRELNDLTTLANRILAASTPEAARSLARQIAASLIRTSEEDQRQQQERESHSMAQIRDITRAAITAGSLGLLPLSDDSTGVFAELVAEYRALLDLAVDERIHRIDHAIHRRLRAMAERLGFLNAGPRDVVEIHIAALRAATQGIPSQKTRAYSQEGQLMVLELMGYLATHYRHYCAIPVRAARPTRDISEE